MKSGSVDFHSTVMLESEPDIEPAANDGNVTVTKWSPNEITFSTSAGAPSILVASEIYYPAWKAYVDGQPAQLLRGDYSLRAVPLAAGDHVVDMKFESDAFGTGRIISIVSLLLVLGGIGYVLARRRSKASPDDAPNATDLEGEE
jgi:uncharacterized membrane protein YfhO